MKTNHFSFLDSALQERQDDAPAIERAFDEATANVPVLETAIVALVVMYDLYLLTPPGNKPVRIVKPRVVKKDGSVETSSDVTYHEPTGALASVVDLISGAKSRRKR